MSERKRDSENLSKKAISSFAVSEVTEGLRLNHDGDVNV